MSFCVRIKCCLFLLQVILGLSTNSSEKMPPVSSSASLSEVARSYIDHDLAVIPLCVDGSKKPKIAWKAFMKVMPTVEQAKAWWATPFGMGVITGSVSGWLEVFDFDLEASTIFPAWYRMVKEIALRLPIVRTPSGGYHVYYRCPVICGSKEIACISTAEFMAEEAKQKELGNQNKIKKILIETRGEGGYVVGVASPAGVHARNIPYVQIAGPELPEVPTITPNERLLLWRAARSFDRSGIRERELKRIRSTRRVSPQNVGPIDGPKPWDRFDREADFVAILRADGWTSADNVHWIRPGKELGHSATLRTTESGIPLLIVFSTNSSVPARKYSASAYIAYSRFAGDFKETCRAIKKGLL